MIITKKNKRAIAIVKFSFSLKLNTLNNDFVAFCTCSMDSMTNSNINLFFSLMCIIKKINFVIRNFLYLYDLSNNL